MFWIIVRLTWDHIWVLVEQLDAFGASWGRTGASQDMRWLFVAWQDDGMCGNSYITSVLQVLLKSAYVTVFDMWEVGVWKC